MGPEKQVLARDFLGLRDFDENALVYSEGQLELGRNEGHEKANESGVTTAAKVRPLNAFVDISTASVVCPGAVTGLSNDQSSRYIGAHNVLSGGLIDGRLKPSSMLPASRGIAGRPIVLDNYITKLSGTPTFVQTRKSIEDNFTGLNTGSAQKSRFQVGPGASVRRDKAADLGGGLGSDKGDKMTITGKPVDELTNIDIQRLTREECRRYLKEKGMRHPSWNKAVVMQQVISLKNLQEEKIVEKGREGFVDWFSPYSFSPLRMKDDTNPKQGNTKFGQAHQFGVSPINHVAGVPEGHSSSSSVGDSACILPDSALCLSLSTLSANQLPDPDSITQRVSPTVIRPVASDPFGRLVNAQLTIFYAGSVNVYDDVPADMAQTIMHFAGSDRSWPTKVMDSDGTACVPTTASSFFTSLNKSTIPPLCLPSMPCFLCTSGMQDQPQKLQLSMQNSQSVIYSQNVDIRCHLSQICAPGGHKNLDLSRPVTPSMPCKFPGSSSAPPRALPQARKASLVRFLEKRRERVSKQPYAVTKDSLKGGFSRGELFRTYPTGVFDKSTKQETCIMLHEMDENVGNGMASCNMKTADKEILDTQDETVQFSLTCY